MRKLGAIVLGIFLSLLLGSCGAISDPITYTFAGTGSGTLGGVDFTDAAFRIVVVADTHGIAHTTTSCAVPGGVCNVYQVRAISASFVLSDSGQIAGFTSPVGVFVNQTFTALGFQRMDVTKADMLDLPPDAAFATYDLSTALGPLGPYSVNPGQFNCNFGCVSTAAGDLSMTTVSNLTFTATKP